MKKLKLHIIRFLFAMTVLPAWGQTNADVPKVFVANNFNNDGIGIYIKFFPQNFVAPEGVNIYRSPVGSDNWEKINASPVKLMETPPASVTQNEEIVKYYDLYKKIRFEDLAPYGPAHGFSALKAVYHNDFAEAVGVMYRDNTVSKGETYRYMVKEIVKGQEIEIGKSIPIKADKWKPVEAMKNISVERKRRMIDFNWEIEMARYFSMNLYKWDEFDETKELWNKSPIMITQPDSAKKTIALLNDNPVSKDTAYYYQLAPVDHFGFEGEISEVFFVPTKDFDPPKEAFNLSYDPDPDKVSIFWNYIDEADLVGFNVYRSIYVDSGYVQVNTEIIPKPDTVFIDQVPDPGDYYYIVGAVDESGNESFSFPFMADVRDVMPPAVPSGLTAKADTGFITLWWNRNIEKDFMGYIVQKSMVGAGAFYNMNKEAITDTFYVDKMQKNQKDKFVYQIVAIDTNLNKSLPSDTVIVQMPDVKPPSVPFIKYIRQTETGLNVVWIPNVDNDLASYTLYRKAKNDTSIIKLAYIISKNDTAVIDTTVLPNISYSYFMSATDSARNESALSKQYSSTFTDTSPKMSISKLSAKFNQKKNTLTLTWNMDTGKDFNGCIVFRKEGNTAFKQFSGKLQSGPFEDKDINDGSYGYQIRMYDKLGNVVISEEVVVEVKLKSKKKTKK